MTSTPSTIFSWQWKGTTLEAPYEVSGQGPPVLLLPAFSTVSSREEMAPLAELLSQQMQTFNVDWPGFGESSRPRVTYAPALFEAFLEDLVDAVFTEPAAVVAGGHAAGYVLSLARRRPGIWSKIALVAPTWRGPLPSAMGERRQSYARLRRLIETPGIGHALYRLNVLDSIIAFMYKRHVYAEPSKVSPAFVRRKAEIARRRNARFASAAFVTGALDLVCSREAFLALFDPLPAPLMVVYGADTPPKSKAEIEALVGFAQVEHHRIAGSLGLHEEHPDAVFKAIQPFLKGRQCGASR